MIRESLKLITMMAKSWIADKNEKIILKGENLFCFNLFLTSRRIDFILISQITFEMLQIKRTQVDL